ncbi:MAG: porphobilinogen synthase [Rhodobacteraceae bacterium]|nr:MAG: porphobilinogen synthase [Paracoccaceae bacterium]
MITPAYPAARPRRLRRTPWVRRLVRETNLTVDDLIWPIFVIEGTNRAEPVPSMPGVERLTIDRAVRAAEEAAALGIPCIELFPNTDPALKTCDCREAWNPENLVCRATRAIKQAVPEIGVMLDVALDPYNADGHDGIVCDGVIHNDRSLDALVRQTLVQAEAGADILGPSDMMDGRVGAMRAALEREGHCDVLIMTYAAKYASCFFSPFRDAVGSGGALKGDKKTYQMDPGNGSESLRETAMDIAEGADMLMVKPGLPYLDVIRRIKEAFDAPVFAYNVSGEYSMIKAAAQAGWLDGERAMMESLAAFKRAGCDGVLTYFAPDAARVLARERQRG